MGGVGEERGEDACALCALVDARGHELEWIVRDCEDGTYLVLELEAGQGLVPSLLNLSRDVLREGCGLFDDLVSCLLKSCEHVDDRVE